MTITPEKIGANPSEDPFFSEAIDFTPGKRGKSLRKPFLFWRNAFLPFKLNFFLKMNQFSRFVSCHC